MDHETRRPLEEELGSRLAEQCAAAVAEAEVILISDYGKGVCTPTVLAPLLATARRQGRPVLVDPAVGLILPVIVERRA